MRSTYAIAGGADAAWFSVDEATGQLSFVAAPDYEAPADADGDNVYKVEVAAISGAYSDIQAFEIEVMNVNEPVAISSNGGGASAALSVVENVSIVTTIVAADPEGAPVTYSIVSGGDASDFTINSQTGLLRFVSAPDFESPDDGNGDNLYAVTVRATAGQHNDVQTIYVTVTNMRDGYDVLGHLGRRDDQRLQPPGAPHRRRRGHGLCPGRQRHGPGPRRRRLALWRCGQRHADRRRRRGPADRRRGRGPVRLYARLRFRPARRWT